MSREDDYVAWLTFRKKDGTHSDGRIRICDSDSPGAFKVYRAAPISAVLESTLPPLDAVMTEAKEVRVFYCVTCRDTGEIEVACPDCGFPKDQGYGVQSA